MRLCLECFSIYSLKKINNVCHTKAIYVKQILFIFIINISLHKMKRSIYKMGVTDLPPKWTMYSVLTKKVVSYSFLLTQKKELQQFIDRFKSKVSNIGSCCILDKMSVTSCEKELHIYIFDGSVGFNSLHLKVILPEQNIRKKVTLLIHLASKNNAMSRLQNLCMYIKCKDCDLWETFCNMFAILLKNSCQNLIGTQFYVSLLCKEMMRNEIKLLHSLGSDFFNFKTKKTYFESKNVEPNISNFVKAQELILQDVIIGGKPKLLPGPDQKLKSIDVSLKRKLNDIENVGSNKSLKLSHEFDKNILCDCHEKIKWKVYKPITLQPVVSYIDLLKEDFDFGNTEYSEIHSDPYGENEIPESLQGHENVKPKLSKSEKLLVNLQFIEKFDPLPSTTQQFSKGILGVELFQTGSMQTGKPKNKSDDNFASHINSKDISNQSVLDKTKNMIQSEYKSFDTRDSNSIKELDQSTESPKYALGAIESSKIETRPTCTSFSNIKQVSSGGFQPLSSCKENMSANTSQTSSSNFGVEKPGMLGFQTAAGKSLKISEKAILAAQKMFDEVCSQEINLFDKDEITISSTPKKPVYPVESNVENDFNSYSKSKKPVYPIENIENDFNSDFADKFFEEFPFDDKEVEFEPKVVPPQPISLKIDSKVPQVGKVRKSLGGRRSLKPYSIKK